MVLLRNLFSQCSSISNELTETQASRAKEALLWVRLSRLFSAHQFLVRDAEIVGLKSKGACPDLTDIFKEPAGHLTDRNNLCFSDTIQYVVTDHAVIPLLAQP